MHRIAQRSLVFAVLATVACHSMVPMTLEEVETQRPASVFVTRDDRSTVELSGPQVFGDTIVGYIGPTFTELPTSDLQAVAVKRTAKGKTMALVAAGIGVAAVMGVLISGLGEEGATANVDCNDVPDDPRCMGQGIP
jgi:hypothetical protein